MPRPKIFPISVDTPYNQICISVTALWIYHNPSHTHCVLQPFVILLSQELLNGLYEMWSMSKGKTKVKVVLSFTDIAGLPSQGKQVSLYSYNMGFGGFMCRSAIYFLWVNILKGITLRCMTKQSYFNLRYDLALNLTKQLWRLTKLQRFHIVNYVLHVAHRYLNTVITTSWF